MKTLWLILLLSLVNLNACKTDTPHPYRSLAQEADTTSRPGDDFFSYANGKWIASTVMPEGKERWNARHEITELTKKQVAKIFEEAQTAPHGTNARKVADFRAAYMNESAIQAAGITPIKPLLDEIDPITDKTALVKLLGRRLRADADWFTYRSPGLLGLSVEVGYFGEKTYVPFLMQGGLGLEERSYYLSEDAANKKIRATYQNYISQQFKQAGFSHPERRAQSVLGIEILLAKTHASDEFSNNDRNGSHRWSRNDFERRAPGMDWSVFFEEAGLKHQESFVVWQPDAITGLASLIAAQPVEVWKDYLSFQAIHAYADVLPSAFAEAALTLRSSIQDAPSPARSQRALDATQKFLGEAVGWLYVERYFPASQKSRVQAIATNVIASLRERVKTVSWMSDESKTQAMVKLQTLYFGLGYPNVWQDYSDLNIDPANPVKNLQNIADRNYRRALARLGKPPDTTEWATTPHTAGALLLFQYNACNFAAALLQAPKFDSTLSDAANYGAIGAIVGHESSHFIDPLGAEWNAERELKHWWTPNDMKKFQSAAKPLVEQFSGYRPFDDLAVNGELTRSENIADLAGLAAAFDAYRKTLGDKIQNQDYVRQQDREFFIGFAQSWRSKTTEKGLRVQIATDHHAPEQYRIATVRNLDAWYDAFDVKPGDKLYLTPESRVRIW
ncbi:MAG TPA: M13 family metallopeptidase [bacterium]|nr:M13 family metallopeptidase [bacterium]